MANTNILRAKKNVQKRAICLMTAIITEGTDVDNEIDGITTGGVNYLIGNIPPNALITDAWIFVKTVSDAATTAVVDIGTAEAGAEIISAADVKSAGKQGSLVATLDSGTGLAVYLEKTTTGAATNVGDYIVYIEYVEYDKTTGEYTSLDA